MPSNSPANTKHFFRDSLPQILFIDTNFFFSALIEYRQNPQRRINSAKFLEKIQQEKKTIAFSSIVFPEFWCAVIINEIVMQKNLQDEQRGSRIYTAEMQARKMIKDDSKLIGEYFPRVKNELNNLEELLSKFKGFHRIIDPTEEIRSQAMTAMGRYCLESYDAIHIGTLAYSNMKDFVSYDEKIQSNCFDLNIWCKY